MALPLPPGLTHAEVAFLAEMELVTVVPRQRLESIDLLSGKTPTLRPPHRADLPLWLALLLKKQRRANILPPAWLHPDSLRSILLHETKLDPEAFSPPPPAPARADPARPGLARRQQQQQEQRESGGGVTLSAPFLASCTADAPAGYLPYHWLEVAEAMLAHAGDDVAASLGSGSGGSGGGGSGSGSGSGAAGEVRGLLRDLVEVRAAKMRSSAAKLEGFGGGLMSLRGVGAMELAESRGFVLGVVDGVRKIGASAEAARREEEEERMGEGVDEGESDEEMGF
ncbi:GINS complex protein-domain-containing protein [Corynascus novoguineensis]|uniref:DNA replication complex GINS protein PSF2 n=1 Tax=Corynascus novoguineensis TaxID=1126955 RepID=A0AAN7D092_9PEZI|nr:GINS complex protein-domain-containing protein [Corynascus novoguineensis]